MSAKRRRLDPGWATTLAVLILLGAAMVAALQPRASIPEPVATVTMTATPTAPTTPTWSGDDLFVEVAAHAGIPTDRIPEARALAREMCKALEAGGPESPATILQATRDVSAGISTNAPGVVTEFGVKAYCPDLVAVLEVR